MRHPYPALTLLALGEDLSCQDGAQAPELATKIRQVGRPAVHWPLPRRVGPSDGPSAR
jgi:hypothetical protein